MSDIYSKRYQKFLKRLRKARKESEMTQVEAATALEKPQSYVSKCENGERRVDIIELSDFAELYKKTIRFLFVIE